VLDSPLHFVTSSKHVWAIAAQLLIRRFATNERDRLTLQRCFGLTALTDPYVSPPAVVDKVRCPCQLFGVSTLPLVCHDRLIFYSFDFECYGSYAVSTGTDNYSIFLVPRIKGSTIPQCMNHIKNVLPCPRTKTFWFIKFFNDELLPYSKIRTWFNLFATIL